MADAPITRDEIARRLYALDRDATAWDTGRANPNDVDDCFDRADALLARMATRQNLAGDRDVDEP